MHDKVTEKDIELMEVEIEHRKLVVRKETLEDVKTARANSLRGWISGDSPLGSAALGHRVCFVNNKSLKFGNKIPYFRIVNSSFSESGMFRYSCVIFSGADPFSGCRAV